MLYYRKINIRRRRGRYLNILFPLVCCSFYTKRPRPLRDAALYFPRGTTRLGAFSAPSLSRNQMRACCNGQPRAGLMKECSLFSPPLLGDTAARRPAALAPVAARFNGGNGRCVSQSQLYACYYTVRPGVCKAGWRRFCPYPAKKRYSMRDAAV